MPFTRQAPVREWGPPACCLGEKNKWQGFQKDQRRVGATRQACTGLWAAPLFSPHLNLSYLPHSPCHSLTQMCIESLENTMSVTAHLRKPWWHGTQSGPSPTVSPLQSLECRWGDSCAHSTCPEVTSELGWVCGPGAKSSYPGESGKAEVAAKEPGWGRVPRVRVA